MAIGTSAANDSLFETLGVNGFFILDDQVIGTGQTTANLGLAVASQCIRVTKSVSSGAVVLPDLITNNNFGGLVAIINDSAQTITIYPFPSSSQTVGGSASTTLASGSSMILLAVQKIQKRGGYANTGAGTDWRTGTFS